MANPQKENGHIKIANEIMDALIKFRIPGVQRQILDFILRKTYGWNIIWARISKSQFIQATGLKRQYVDRGLKSLLKKLIIRIKKDSKTHSLYCFNKNYETWKSESKRIHRIKKDSKVNQKGFKKGFTPYSSKDIYKDNPILKKSGKNRGKEIYYLTKKKRKLKGKRLETFLRFWDAFDFKNDKAEAADSWLDIPKLTDTLVNTICDAAVQEKNKRADILQKGSTPKWAQGWLSSRRWEKYEEILKKNNNTQELSVLSLFAEKVLKTDGNKKFLIFCRDNKISDSDKKIIIERNQLKRK